MNKEEEYQMLIKQTTEKLKGRLSEDQIKFGFKKIIAIANLHRLNLTQTTEILIHINQFMKFYKWVNACPFLEALNTVLDTVITIKEIPNGG